MNEKIAKALRRKIRNHPDSQKIPDVNYIQRNTRLRKFHLPGLDDDGNPRSVVLQMRQIRLGNCKRAICKRVKRALSR